MADAMERFWSRVEKTETCWLWQGYRNWKGYGRFHVSHGKEVFAHRLAYETLVGPIQEGLQIDHLCSVRACVNPAHLEPVTPAVNAQRALKGKHLRQVCANGHAYDEANTYIDYRGHQRCRACRPKYVSRRSAVNQDGVGR